MHDGKEVLIAPSIPWPVSGPSAKLIFGDSRLQENKGIQGVFRRLCSQIPDSFLCRNMQRPFRYSMNGNRTELEQVVQSHTSNIAPERLAERGWCTKSQSSLLNIYFRVSGFQSSLLLIHFCYGPNTCLHYTQEWYRISSICDSPLQTPVRRSFTYRNRAKIRSIWVSRKLPTYPSPKLTLTLISHLG